MKLLTKSLYILSTIIICFTIIYLPFYDTRNLFKSYITEQVFLFAAVTGVLLLLQALILLFSPKQYKGIKITWLEMALFAFVAYLSLNRFFISEMGGITLKYYRLIVLCIFYIIIRNFPSKYYPYFIYSLLISGIIQAVYGNLQFYDIYSSRHHLFNITGSFFNPGPYAGYLLIPATRSRASWLATIAGSIIVFYHYDPLRPVIKRYLNTRWKKLLSIMTMVFLVVGLSASIYYMKKDRPTAGC